MQIQGRTTQSQSAAVLERLARLVAAGASPSRAAAVACALAAELRWGTGCWREQLEQLQTELDESIRAAEEYAADLEQADTSLLHAQLEALRTARQSLQTETGGAQEQWPATLPHAPGQWLGDLRRYG